jgi:hypothetical protein
MIKYRLNAVRRKAEKTGSLDEAALAGLPSKLADQRRTAGPLVRCGSKCEELEPSISGPLLPPKANVGMGQTRSGRSARLSPKVLAISAHTIFKLEQTAGAALNDAFLRQIVDNLRRHPKTARQSVG